MKKQLHRIILTAALCLAALTAAAQGPTVTVTIDETTPTTITATFTKGSACEAYYICCALEEEILPYVGTPIGGPTFETTIIAWGIRYTNSQSYTWDDMAPGTAYNVYVVAVGGGDTLMSATPAPTPMGGGSGASEIAITASDITSHSATLTCTPNDQTSSYKDMLLTKDYFDEIGADSVTAYLKEDYYTYVAADTWNWDGLEFDTEYIMCAIGVNGNSEWGELDTLHFRTLAAGDSNPSVIEIDTSTTNGVLSIAFAPNASTARYWVKACERLDIDGFTDDSVIALLTSEVAQYTNKVFDLTGLEQGVQYVVMAVGQNGARAYGEISKVYIGQYATIGKAEAAPFRVYPNPATDHVTIDGLTAGAILTIADLQGRIVRQTAATGAAETLTLEGLPRGLYMLNVAKEGKSSTIKLAVR